MVMGIGDKIGNGKEWKQPVRELEWPLFPWESIPISGYMLSLCNS